MTQTTRIEYLTALNYGKYYMTRLTDCISGLYVSNMADCKIGATKTVYMLNPTCGFTKYEVRRASFKNILDVLIENLENVADDDCQTFLGNCISRGFQKLEIIQNAVKGR